MAEASDKDPSYGRAVILAGIIHKSREKGPLTDEEKELLEGWLNENQANRSLYESLLRRDQVAIEVEDLFHYDADKGVAAVFAAIGERVPKVVPMWKGVVRQSLMTAVILLLVIGGIWLFTTFRHTNPGVSAVVSADVQPGTDRAVLTLADGSQVTLDSSHQNTIALQGSASVKQSGDRLIYTATENDASIVYNTLTVPRGAKYHLVLSDSSEIWLNAASSITYPVVFSSEARMITISGEAYFSVAKNKARPFLVTAGTMNIQVLGTEFNVMAYADEPAIRTTLINGAVKASAAGAQGQTQELVLKPGEQAALNDSTRTLRRAKANLDAVLGWHSGEFRFNDTELPAIMREVARWYDVQVEYRGPITHIGFNGELSRKHKVDDLLDILSDTRKVHFERKTPNIIVVIPGSK